MRSLGQPVGSLAADLIGVSMITCKNDRLLELLWFVGYCIEFPTQLAVRIGGGAEWNRRVMYRAIREGYVRLYRKKHKRHVIRSMSLTQKGFEYVAQRDPEAVSMIYSRVNSSERIYPGWIDKILRLHAIAPHLSKAISHVACQKINECGRAGSQQNLLLRRTRVACRHRGVLPRVSIQELTHNRYYRQRAVLLFSLLHR